MGRRCGSACWDSPARRLALRCRARTRRPQQTIARACSLRIAHCGAWAEFAARARPCRAHRCYAEVHLIVASEALISSLPRDHPKPHVSARPDASLERSAAILTEDTSMKFGV